MKQLTREKFPEGQEDETNSKDLKIRPERSWYLTPILYYTLRSLGGGGGEPGRDSVVKEKKPLPERARWEN